MRIQHLVWDFDGTLYDTYPQMTAAMALALNDLGFSAENAEIYRLIKGTVYAAVQTYAQRFGIPTDALLAAFQLRHAQQQQRFPLMQGATECLQKARSLGCHHYLFTHRDRLAIKQLTADGLAPLFSDFVTREDGFADKPSPEAVLHLMRKHGFSADSTLMVGDRDIDILSGQAAGVSGILLDPCGFYPELQPAYRIQRLAEIPPLIQNT